METHGPGTLPSDLTGAVHRLGVRGIRHVRWYPEVASTSDVAARLAERGDPDWTVVVADAQSAGRGRLGRRWVSPAGAGLYASLILRPRFEGPELLAIAAGVAVAEGIQRASGGTAVLKWPNDLYMGGGKVAGILAESGISGGARHVILGVGINLRPAALPPELSATATSLEHELGRPVDRGLVLVECLERLLAWYGALAAGRRRDVVGAWCRHAAPTVGCRVEWDDPEGTRRGVVDGLDETGALIVRSGRGRVRLIGGAVRWI